MESISRSLAGIVSCGIHICEGKTLPSTKSGVDIASVSAMSDFLDTTSNNQSLEKLLVHAVRSRLIPRQSMYLKLNNVKINGIHFQSAKVKIEVCKVSGCNTIQNVIVALVDSFGEKKISFFPEERKKKAKKGVKELIQYYQEKLDELSLRLSEAEKEQVV